MMMRLSSTLIIVIISAVFWTSKVSATCCGAPCKDICQIYSSNCDDCTKTTPYCGLGSCNIFGCNCDGGCKKGVNCWNCNCPIRATAFAHSHPPVEPLSDAEYQARSEEHLEKVLAQADQSGDGRISRQEFEQWVEEYHPTPKSQRSFILKDEFKEIDLDQSGYLTKEEIDPQ